MNIWNLKNRAFISGLFVIILMKTGQCFGLVSCHSCFNACPQFSDCDCTSHDRNNSSDTCMGDYCFVKLEKITDYAELGSAFVVFKGCGYFEKAENSGPIETLGCHYYGEKTSVKCICKNNLCNERQKLDLYEPKAQPRSTCCACNTREEEADIGCMPTSCDRNCVGEFCYVDLVRQRQGCGFGYPEMFLDLRTPGNFSDWLKSNQTCGLKIAGDPGPQWTRTCACLGSECNQFQVAYDQETNGTERVKAKMTYCYNFANSSTEPITLDAYKKSDYCEGHVCFVSYKNVVKSKLTASGIRLSITYEMVAGCLMSDNWNKMEVGCTTEWSSNPSAPYNKHCVCSGDYCNLYNLFNGDSKDDFLVFRKNSSRPRFKQDWLNLTIICCSLLAIFVV